MSEDAEDETPERRTKHQQDWRCPECGLEITTFVKLRYTPGCGNTTQHKSKSNLVDMVRV